GSLRGRAGLIAAAVAPEGSGRGTFPQRPLKGASARKGPETGPFFFVMLAGLARPRGVAPPDAGSPGAPKRARHPTLIRPSTMKKLLALVAAAVMAVAAAPASAQSWPSRPIKLVIPFPAGGATDIVGRTIAQKLSAALGQNVVVENRPGAGGTIGADQVAKAAPDGYTILMATSSTHSIGPLINPKIPYDPFKDFAPVAHVASAPSVLVVGGSSPVKSATELIDL